MGGRGQEGGEKMPAASGRVGKRFVLGPPLWAGAGAGGAGPLGVLGD